MNIFDNFKRANIQADSLIDEKQRMSYVAINKVEFKFVTIFTSFCLCIPVDESTQLKQNLCILFLIVRF